MKEVTREEFLAWKKDHVTQTVFLIIDEMKSQQIDALIDGQGLDDKGLHGRLLGRLEAYSSILNMDYASEEGEQE